TLRAMGRLEAALAQYDDAIRRFPDNAVVYTGRAETLRAMGRLDAALAQYDDATTRFPNDDVSYVGRAYILVLLGRYEAVRHELKLPGTRLVSVYDWIRVHILAMADLREGKIDAAVVMLSDGAANCPFPLQRRFFISALAVARLRLSREDL